MVCENLKIIKIQDLSKKDYYFYKSGCKKNNNYIYSLHTLWLRKHENCADYKYNEKIKYGYMWTFVKYLYRNFPINKKSQLIGSYEEIFSNAYEEIEKVNVLLEIKETKKCPHCGGCLDI